MDTTAQLPSDALLLVFDKLPAAEARVTVGRVCTSWCNAARQHKQQHPPDRSARPHLPLWYFKALWGRYGSRRRHALTAAAATHGQVDLLQHASESQGQLNSLLVSGLLSEHGHVAGLQWSHTRPTRHGGPLLKVGDTNMCINGARNGHLSVLQWLRDNGYPWNAGIYTSAARGGHLAVMQWALEQGRTCSEWTCKVGYACSSEAAVLHCAAGGGHLAALQWARANGCPWDAHACIKAASNGHLAVLQWAYEDGCPWRLLGLRECVRVAGSREVEQWCKEMLMGDHMALQMAGLQI